MRTSKSTLILLAAVPTVCGAVLATGPRVLEAQVIRCYDVVCSVGTDGKMRCSETPAPCPKET